MLYFYKTLIQELQTNQNIIMSLIVTLGQNLCLASMVMLLQQKHFLICLRHQVTLIEE